MRRFAITGGIACGKSAVAGMMAERGIEICDSDILARKVLEKRTREYEKTVSEFGSNIIGPDGEIDRKALGDIVFSNEHKRRKLNSIVHPVVRQMWQQWIDAQTGTMAVIVPLLYEEGFESGWDGVICVTASRSIQIERLALRGFARGDAELRIDSQMSLDAKCKRSDFVIVNNYDFKMLGLQVHRTVNILLGENI